MDYIGKTAEALGLSKSTVCRAISHSRFISADTSRLVIDYISEHYPEKLEARRLARQKRGRAGGRITVIMPCKPQYFWNMAIRGIEDAIASSGRSDIKVNYIYYTDSISEAAVLAALDEVDPEAADAIAMVPVDTALVAERLRGLSESMPIALFNESCADSGSFITVVSDGYAQGIELASMLSAIEAREGAEVLVLKGERYPARIVGERLAGFCERARSILGEDAVRHVDFEPFAMTHGNGLERYDYSTMLPSRYARMIAEEVEASRAVGRRIAAVYTPNGNLLPLFIALRKLGMLDVVVLGHEINARALDFFMSGVRGGYVKEDSYLQGYAAIKSLIAKLSEDKKIYPDRYVTLFDIRKFT